MLILLLLLREIWAMFQVVFQLSAESASSWFTTATSQIDITFLQPGNYDVTLFTGSSGQSNRCGITYFTPNHLCNPLRLFRTSTSVPIWFAVLLKCHLLIIQVQRIAVFPISMSGQSRQQIQIIVLYQIVQIGNLLMEQVPHLFEPDFQFNTPGIYEVSLTVSLDIATAGTMCEPDTLSKVITIKEKPQTTLPVVELCENESYTFDLEVFDCYAEQAATFLWDFQGASGVTVSDVTALNPTITFTTAGTYPYTLTLTNECGDNILSGSIDIFPEVLITASGPTVTCVECGHYFNWIH